MNNDLGSHDVGPTTDSGKIIFQNISGRGQTADRRQRDNTPVEKVGEYAVDQATTIPPIELPLIYKPIEKAKAGMNFTR